MPNRRPLDPGRASPVLAAALLTPAAIFFAAGAHADPGNPDQAPAPVAEDAPPDFDAAPPPETPADAPPPPPEESAEVGIFGPPPSHSLPAGIASEQGLQVNTILVSRTISETFPQIRSMIGVRPDSRPWHPSGRALDVIIPDPGSPEGIALGDQVVAFAMSHADRFGLQDAIWRGTYYTPAGPTSSGYGHFDHVHITTLGGGYPTGNEEYPREDGAPPPPDQQA